MNFTDISAALAELAIGPIRYFEQIDSTNTEAVRWVDNGCPNLALVLADEQTAGKGRAGRQWFTPPGTALAFSLIIKPGSQIPGQTWPAQAGMLPRITALGALAVCEALRIRYGLSAQIKWPNDVLCSGRKCCGVLAEAIWQGDSLAAIILGIGINVKPASVLPDKDLAFPATCVETALQESGADARTVSRLDLLQAVLEELLKWRQRIAGKEFIQAWENRLAFRNEWVRVSQSGFQSSVTPDSVIEGLLLGLALDGQLRLRDRTGRSLTLHSGALNLRPIEYDE
jgi:BirA family biotin operon repressor/biotin-[acetyl-CoA-carboxylase] ligase